MHEVNFVVLAHSHDSIQDIIDVQDLRIINQVWWVQFSHILMHIVHFNHAHEPEVARFDWQVLGICGADLEETVEVALVHDSEASVGDPLKPGSKQLEGFLSLQVIPERVDQILWEIIVYILRSWLNNLHLSVLEVKVQLELEVGREEKWHTCLLYESLRVSLNSEKGLPSDLLTAVWLPFDLRVSPSVKTVIDAIILDIEAFVNDPMLIIDNL